MTLAPCQLLDAYIKHDLSGDERARFEAHLPACPECQRSVRDETGLDALLSAAVIQLEPVPERLTERITGKLRRARRRRVVAGIAALAACVAFFVMIGQALLRDRPPAPTTRVEPVHQPPVASSPPPTIRVRVRFPNTADVLAIPVASDSPNVTLVQVYPGLRERGSAGHDYGAD